MSGKDGRTEAPTPKRRRDARKKGQVARSHELLIWVQLLTAVLMLQLTFTLLGRAFRRVIDETAALAAQPEAPRAWALLGQSLLHTMLAVGPLAGGAIGVAIVSHLGQTGLHVSPHNLRPKFERINPMKGFKRIFSAQGGLEVAKNLVRVAVICAVMWGPSRRLVQSLSTDPTELSSMLSRTARATITMLRNVAIAGLVMGVVDFALQQRLLRKQLRMTKQEVKQEMRESEGDPHVKGQRRSRQMEMSRNRMMAEVPKATAVIVNPTHVAVAIRYQPAVGAPKVLAKGIGGAAARIRREAERHGVPVVHEVGLARALYVACDIGEEIPMDLYEAVARLLAFVMTVGRRARWAGPLRMHRAVLPAARAQVGTSDADLIGAARRAAARKPHGRRRGAGVRNA